MKGKTCIVTGATSGIGEVTAHELAKAGARVVITGRSRRKCERVRDEIRRKSQSELVELVVFDMADQDDIRRGAAEILERCDRIDVLVNNAGAVNTRRYETAQGIELTFGVNHLGYFLLTHLLLDKLKASAPSRIVNVASRAHIRSDMRFDDLQGKESYSGFRIYCQSKLANVMYTYALARRLEGTGVTVNCLHPGVIGSGFGHGADGFFRYLVKLGKPFLWTPEKGATSMLHLACSPDVEGVNGRYFDEHGRETESSRASLDEAAQERLWKISEEMTGTVS